MTPYLRLRASVEMFAGTIPLGIVRGLLGKLAR